MRALLWLVIGASGLGCQRAEPPPLARAALDPAALARVASSVEPALSPTATGAPAPSPVAWATALEPILFRNVNTRQASALRLYSPDGSVDEAAALRADALLAGEDVEAFDHEDKVPRPISRRLLQLIVRAAEHFKATEVDVISSWRESKRKGSRHRHGEAIDFTLLGVKPKALASYLRDLPRVGVGIYTHPRTQFVHLDVREQSYHWLDASPPNRVWRELRLPDLTAPARDAAYALEQDLPESAATLSAAAP